MFGKIIGAIGGAKAAAHSRKVGGARGALMGLASASVLKRLSIPAMLVLGAGGYAFKKYRDREEEREKRKAKAKAPKVQPSAT